MACNACSTRQPRQVPPYQANGRWCQAAEQEGTIDVQRNEQQAKYLKEEETAGEGAVAGDVVAEGSRTWGSFSTADLERGFAEIRSAMDYAMRQGGLGPKTRDGGGVRASRGRGGRCSSKGARWGFGLSTMSRFEAGGGMLRYSGSTCDAVVHSKRLWLLLCSPLYVIGPALVDSRASEHVAYGAPTRNRNRPAQQIATQPRPNLTVSTRLRVKSQPKGRTIEVIPPN